MTPPRRPPRAAPATFEIRIDKLVYGGMGLGRHEGKVVFVPFTVPGDRTDELILESGRVAAGGFDRLIIKEDGDRRGRRTQHADEVAAAQRGLQVRAVFAFGTRKGLIGGQHETHSGEDR